MLVRDAFDRLQLHYNLILNNEIGKIVTETKAITVKDFQRFLSLNSNTLLPKAMCQTIFINLLQQPSTKIHMQVVSDLTNLCHKFSNICVLHLATPNLSAFLHLYTAILLPLHFYTSTRPFFFLSTLLHGHFHNRLTRPK